MNIRKWVGNKSNKFKLRTSSNKGGGSKMCVLAKAVNYNFIVDKNKAEKFLKTSHKSNMEKILAKAERFEKNLKK